MSEDQRKHLEFIQNIISRCNSNSFQIKGLAITIATALVAVFTSTDNILFLWMAGALLTLFWILDGYYLSLERRFRALYADLISKDRSQNIALYTMPIENYRDSKCTIIRSTFSSHKIALYLPIIITIAILGVIYNTKSDGEKTSIKASCQCAPK